VLSVNINLLLFVIVTMIVKTMEPSYIFVTQFVCVVSADDELEALDALSVNC